MTLLMNLACLTSRHIVRLCLFKRHDSVDSPCLHLRVMKHEQNSNPKYIRDEGKSLHILRCAYAFIPDGVSKFNKKIVAYKTARDDDCIPAAYL